MAAGGDQVIPYCLQTSWVHHRTNCRDLHTLASTPLPPCMAHKTDIHPFQIHACHGCRLCWCTSSQLESLLRLLCAGYFGIQQAECEGKGCCWRPTSVHPSAVTRTRQEVHAAPGQMHNRELHADLPWCFFPNAMESHYTVHAVQETGKKTPA